MKKWIMGVIAWIRMLLPTGRVKLLEQAYTQGRGHGRMEMLYSLANMNRQQRRRTIRKAVKQLKEDQ